MPSKSFASVLASFVCLGLACCGETTLVFVSDMKDLTGGAGQPDADLIDGKVTGSVADGAEDAAPVGVPAKDT